MSGYFDGRKLKPTRLEKLLPEIVTVLQAKGLHVRGIRSDPRHRGSIFQIGIYDCKQQSTFIIRQRVARAFLSEPNSVAWITKELLHGWRTRKAPDA